VRNLALAYTLAGADCIDVAADPAAIAAVQEGLQVAATLTTEAQQRGFGVRGKPWLMVSLNDGEDPHFRKAEFNPAECPAECPRPCQSICPASAIVFPKTALGQEKVSLGASGWQKKDRDRLLNINSQSHADFAGVIDQICYGCGRCLPICPSQLIFTRSYVLTPQAIAPLILESGIDALEIHTQIGRITDFQRLWAAISPWLGNLKLLAISCPDGAGVIDYMRSLYQAIAPLPCPLIWQTDGRAMSGDIGMGATHAAIQFGQKVLAADLPGYVQLAGGTNGYTVTKLASLGLLGKIAGIGYGSYARAIANPILEQLEKGNQQHYVSESFTENTPIIRLENSPELLWEAVAIAHSLVSQIKLIRE
jgi:Fe-S-cluster-containing hydrogenase component 2